MSEGRFAQFTDLAGAMFAVWQPGSTKGLDAVNDPDTLCWTELTTPDAPGAKSFYSDVLGWETDDQPMGEFTQTVVRSADGGESSGQGRIMPLSPEIAAAGATTRWQPYFEVADCDATAAAVTANGGPWWLRQPVRLIASPGVLPGERRTGGRHAVASAAPPTQTGRLGLCGLPSLTARKRCGLTGDPGLS
jgi:predicted enzyme related to lactoylglutathione lyase